MNEEHGIRIVTVLDGQECVIMGAEERLLPVELVWRRLRTHDKTKE